MQHGDDVFSLAFTPDGKSIVSAGAGTFIRVWDVNNGKPLCGLDVPDRLPSVLNSVAISPDGRVAAAADYRGRFGVVWNLTAGKPLCAWDGPRLGDNLNFLDVGGCVAFSADNRLLATADADNQVRLRNQRTGKVVRTLSEATGPIAFSPDGKLLATRRGHETVIWNVENGQCTRRFFREAERPGALAFSSDSKWLATGYRDGTILIWDVSNGEERQRFTRHKHKDEANRGGVNALAFTAGGKVASASAERIFLWDATSGEVIREFKGHVGEVFAAVVSADGKTLAAAGGDGTIRLWEVATGKAVLPYEGHGREVQALAFDPSGDTLASASSDSVCTWNMKDLKLIRQVGISRFDIGCLVYSNEGKLLLGGDREGACLYDLGNGRELAHLGGRGDSLAVSASGTCLASRQKTGRVRLRQVNGKEAHEFGERREGLGKATAFCVLSPDGSLVATGAPDEPTKVWRAKGELVHDFNSTGRLAAFSNDSQLLAVAGDEVTVYDMQTGMNRTLRGHRPDVCGITFSGDSRVLASMDADGEVRVWELATGKVRVSFRDGFQSEHFADQWSGAVHRHCMAMSPDGSLLALAGFDATILLWDVAALAFKSGRSSFSENEVLRVWDDLAGDATRAYQGMCRLMQGPAQAVSFLKGRLSPAPQVDPARIARCIADLDDDSFEVRERASLRLAEFGDTAEPALRALLQGSPSAESRKRAEKALAAILAEPKAEALRVLRAIEILEHIGTPDACRLLEELSKGAAEARVTREARASLDRIARRGAVAPKKP
jgi:WD40 repeat protein